MRSAEYAADSDMLKEQINNSSLSPLETAHSPAQVFC